jgi:hypothetical protein
MMRIYAAGILAVTFFISLVAAPPIANAATPPLLKPSQLSPTEAALNGPLYRALDQAFDTLQSSAAVEHLKATTGGVQAVQHLVVTLPIKVAKPQIAGSKSALTFMTHVQTVDATATAAFILAVQKRYITYLGKALRPNEAIDLDAIATKKSVTVRAYDAKGHYTAKSISFSMPSKVSSHQIVDSVKAGSFEPNQPTNLQSTGTPMLTPSFPSSATKSTPTAKGPCAEDSTKDAISKTISDEWDALQKFNGDPCSLLSAGNAIEALAPGAQLPGSSIANFTFGNPASAQGTLAVTPSVAVNNGTLNAKLQTTFGVVMLNSKPFTVLDGTAGLALPPAASTTQPSITIDVTGAAFTNESIYHSDTQLGSKPLHVQYTANPSKKFTFWTITQSWSFSGITLNATVDLNGTASLSYDVLGGVNGLYATAQPSVGASADTSFSVTGILTGFVSVNVDAKLNIQNSDSTVTAVGELVHWTGHGDYVVSRAYAQYAPWDYAATVTVSGKLAGISFKPKVMFQTKPATIGSPYTFDSGWQASKL